MELIAPTHRFECHMLVAGDWLGPEGGGGLVAKLNCVALLTESSRVYSIRAC